MPGFDQHAEQIAQQYPGLIGNASDEGSTGDLANRQGGSLSENLWNLIQEGKGKMPMWHDPEHIANAVNFAANNAYQPAGATTGDDDF